MTQRPSVHTSPFPDPEHQRPRQVAAQGDREDMSELIERSPLGAAAARMLRRRTPRDKVAEILQRAAASEAVGAGARPKVTAYVCTLTENPGSR